MTAEFLGDALGPRGRRQVRIATAVSGVVLAGVVFVALRRAGDKGQLDWDKWHSILTWPVLKFLLLGLVNTLKVAGAAMAMAMVVGALMALGRLARFKPVAWAAGAYVDFFRAMPLLLLILFCGFGLPRYHVNLSNFWYLAIALTAYNGAVLGEIFRAGILSLDRGQSEAASSLGMRYWQAMALVIVPQAARRMIPAIVSQLVTLLKDTSLGFVISYEELLRRGRITGEFTHNLLQAYTVVALMYIAVNFTLSRIARRLEVRQRRRYGASSIKVAGIEDLAVLAAPHPDDVADGAPVAAVSQ